MPRERKARHSELGRFLRGFRLRKHGNKLGQEAVADKAVAKGIPLTRQRLRSLELGEHEFPPREALEAFVQYFKPDANYAAIVAEVVRHTYGVSLSVAETEQARAVRNLQKALDKETGARVEAEARLARAVKALKEVRAVVEADESPPGRTAAGH